jgi:hypothetical protein
LLILHIDTGVEMRGGQWQALYLLRGLAAAGIGVRLLAPANSPLLQAALAQQLDARPLGLRTLSKATPGVDLIHAHDARAHNFALLTGKPLVVSRRVAFPPGHGLASRRKYRRPARFIAVSDYVRQMLLDAGVAAERIEVVYDGVPIPPPIKPEQRTRVLALDSNDPGKGKSILEQAAALCDIPISFSSNLSRDLPEAALFVYITSLEGLGSAALLAMAYGVPVIASNVGGLPEIVVDGETGLLTSNQPTEVARTIQRLLSDRALAERLAARARIRVEKEFSIDRMVHETQRVYERILA